MKKLISTISMVAILLSNGAYAGGFACVDTQEVMQKSTFAKSLGQEINQKVAQAKEKLEAYSRELKNLQKEIESKAISKQAKKQKIKEYEDTRLKALEYQQDAQKEIQKLQEQAGKEFTMALKNAVSQYAKSHNLDGVFDCGQMLYYANLDITPYIIKAIDSSHSTRK